MPATGARLNYAKKEMELNIVRRGANPGFTKARVQSIKVGKSRAVRMEQVKKLSRGLRKVNFATAPPKKLYNIALTLISIEELSTVKFGPKKQPVLYEGPLVNGLPTGLQQELINIVGRVQRRKDKADPRFMTDGEVRFLKGNLPNMVARLDQFLAHI